MTNKIKILKPSQSTESRDLIGSNDDLLTEILLRLPVTSILRFKSVSKHWRRLLSDMQFTLRFDKLIKSPGIFANHKYVPFDVEDRSPPPFHTLDFHFDCHGIGILRSCNGLLLCMSGDDISKRHAIRDPKFYVFNPTTKQFAIIPGRQAVLKTTIVSMSLAFHQTDCVHFKIVCVLKLQDLHRKLYQIQVYSSNTGKWKISIESFSSDTGPIPAMGVYWNGAIYWAHCPLYYKVDVEELHSVPLPSPLSKLIYFGESRGHLHLISNKYGKLLHLNVYEMLSDHSGWFLKYQLELDDVLSAFPEMIPMFNRSLRLGFDVFGVLHGVVDMVRGEKDEDTFLVLLIREKLITYNIHDKSFKLVSILPFKAYFISSSFNRYTEALASI